MTYVYLVFDKVTQFFSWLNTEVGLKPWHVQTIAAIIVIILLLLLMHLRKNRIEKIHKKQRTRRSEIIGLKLSDRRTRHRRTIDRKKQEEDLIPEEENQHKPWGQTTKDWRQLREQIRKLQHDITKNQRTQEKLKKQIDELKNINEQLKEEIISHKQTENDLNQQINELNTINEKQEKETAVKVQDSNIKQPGTRRGTGQSDASHPGDNEESAALEEKIEVNQELTKQSDQTISPAGNVSDSHLKEGQAHLNVQPEISLTEPEQDQEKIQSSEEKDNSEQIKTDLLTPPASPAPASPDASPGGGQDEVTGPANSPGVTLAEENKDQNNSDKIVENKNESQPFAASPARDGQAHSPGDIPATSTGEITTQTQAPTSGDASSTVRHPVESNGEKKENQNAQLDIKELRAIADLAKRLQGGGQQKA